MSATEVDDVLKLIGCGSMQVLMVFSCGMTCLYLINEIMGINFVCGSIAEDFQMNNVQLSLLASSAFLGLILATHYSGYKSDQIGRRIVMLYSLGLGLAASLISMLMPSFPVFLLFRFLTGLMLSGGSCVFLTYITECTQITFRPHIVTFMSYFFALGWIYVPGVAYLFQPLNRIVFSWGTFDICRWRISLLVNAIPGFVAFGTMFILPETPKFLLSKRKDERAFAVLNRLCIINHRKDLKSFGVTSVWQDNVQEDQSPPRCCLIQMWLDTKPLFKPPYVRPFLHVTAVVCCLFFVGNGLVTWFSKLRSDLTNEKETMCGDFSCEPRNNTSGADDKSKSNVYMDGIILGVTALSTFIFTSILLVWVKRSLILFINSTIAFLCGFSLNFWTNQHAILIALVVFLSPMACSISLAGSALCDVMPTHMRANAVSLALTFGRLAVIIASGILGFFFCMQCYVVFNIFVLFAAACAVLSWFLTT
ncbi:synaptic vesicle glycoprotein 2A isoform X1 [Drosophila busckii]|uniref:synaptic vesicle glycoprotein 2A isoform X1 n=2 Tax=Drosophila busckii TaxID=30019 RepID=UPI001432C3EA|nr:synaptic vesicle glycoprotein 2A isoform X1 [Drosophila busckii]